MHCSRFTNCTVLVAGLFFISISQFGVANGEQSPFSLESTGQTIAERSAVAPPSGQQQGTSSAFALPPEGETAPAPSSGDAGSPFALPSERNAQNSKGDSPRSPVQPPMNDESSALDGLTALELQQKGTALAREGKFEDARVTLAHSLKKDPGNLITLNNLGLVMRKLGRLDDAFSAYLFALELDKEYALTYKNLGILLEKNGDKEQAVQAYRKYCLLAPQAVDVKKVTARADWLEGKK